MSCAQLQIPIRRFQLQLAQPEVVKIQDAVAEKFDHDLARLRPLKLKRRYIGLGNFDIHPGVHGDAARPQQNVAVSDGEPELIFVQAQQHPAVPPEAAVGERHLPQDRVVGGQKVIIVGAGLAGLACARRLLQAGIPFLILEADQRLGGRIKTDNLNGFILNHGFQVLQTAYPEANRNLDYSRLALKPFAPGAIIRIDGRFHRIADPRRHPRDLLSTLTAPIGT